MHSGAFIDQKEASDSLELDFIGVVSARSLSYLSQSSFFFFLLCVWRGMEVVDG